MTSYAWPLQQALYSALAAADITGVSKIVDHRIVDPADSDFPYLQIGEDGQSLQDDVSCANGSQEVVNIHVWSRQRGQKQVKQIRDAVVAALHDTSSAVAGLASCHVFYETARILEDPDGLTRHGVVTFRIHCRET